MKKIYTIILLLFSCIQGGHAQILANILDAKFIDLGNVKDTGYHEITEIHIPSNAFYIKIHLQNKTSSTLQIDPYSFQLNIPEKDSVKMFVCYENEFYYKLTRAIKVVSNSAVILELYTLVSDAFLPIDPYLQFEDFLNDYEQVMERLNTSTQLSFSYFHPSCRHHVKIAITRLQSMNYKNEREVFFKERPCIYTNRYLEIIPYMELLNNFKEEN